MAETPLRKGPAAYGVAGYPTMEGDLYGQEKRIPAPTPREPPNEPGRTAPIEGDGFSEGNDTFEAANEDAQLGAVKSGLMSGNTAQALLREMHQRSLKLPGRERAKFLDGMMRYQQAVTDTLKAMRRDPMREQVTDGLPSGYEAPPPNQQQAQQIGEGMGMGPDELAQATAGQGGAPTTVTMARTADDGAQQGMWRPMEGEGGGAEPPTPSAANGPYTRRDKVMQAKGY